MKVLKPINNNVVSCVDAAGREVVAMGRGLGYGVKPGADMDEDVPEKIFRMDSQGDTDKLKHMLLTLPAEEIELCGRIIAYADQTLNKKLSPSVYLTLTDHLVFALDRMRQGMAFQNALLTEVRLFYPREFAVGQYALDRIQTEMHVTFPEDEAANIALHLVNAEYDTSISGTLHSTQALHDIISLLAQWPGVHPREDSLYFDELVVHLKLLVLRVFSNQAEPEPEPAFVSMIRSRCPREYECAQAVGHYLERQSGRPVGEEDTAYLAIQIHRANDRKAR